MITRQDIMLWTSGFAIGFLMLTAGMHFLVAAGHSSSRVGSTYGGFSVVK